MTQTNLQPTCPDCAATIGGAHDNGCDVARCLATGGQRIQCDGHDDTHPYAEHDCGQQTWTGRWPGEAECAEFGWWVQDRCAEGLGFVPCAPDAPGATEDLNRLVRDAVWDAQAGRWQRRIAEGQQ
jgi:hypothetical protein